MHRFDQPTAEVRGVCVRREQNGDHLPGEPRFTGIAEPVNSFTGKDRFARRAGLDRHWRQGRLRHGPGSAGHVDLEGTAMRRRGADESEEQEKCLDFHVKTNLRWEATPWRCTT